MRISSGGGHTEDDNEEIVAEGSAKKLIKEDFSE